MNSIDTGFAERINVLPSVRDSPLRGGCSGYRAARPRVLTIVANAKLPVSSECVPLQMTKLDDVVV